MSELITQLNKTLEEAAQLNFAEKAKLLHQLTKDSARLFEQKIVIADYNAYMAELIGALTTHFKDASNPQEENTVLDSMSFAVYTAAERTPHTCTMLAQTANQYVSPLMDAVAQWPDDKMKGSGLETIHRMVMNSAWHAANMKNATQEPHDYLEVFYSNLSGIVANVAETETNTVLVEKLHEIKTSFSSNYAYTSYKKQTAEALTT